MLFYDATKLCWWQRELNALDNAGDIQSRNLYKNLAQVDLHKKLACLSRFLVQVFLVQVSCSKYNSALMCTRNLCAHEKIKMSDWSAVWRCAGVNRVAVVVAWGVLLTVKSICGKYKILQIYIFICISIPKYNTCNGDVSDVVNVVLCNAVKLLLLWCHLGNKFWEFWFWKFLVYESCIKIWCRFPVQETCACFLYCVQDSWLCVASIRVHYLNYWVISWLSCSDAA